MPIIKFHFRLGSEDAPSGAGATEVQLIPNQHSLGHGIGAMLQTMNDLTLAPTEVGVDFLLLGNAVMMADKHVSRSAKSEDSWSREIELSIPVSDPALWRKVEPRLKTALGFLTGDFWSFEFRARPKGKGALAQPAGLIQAEFDRISLFSGGLDSFIGAVDQLHRGFSVLFVSHSALGTDSIRQRRLIPVLEKAYPKNVCHLRGSIMVEAAGEVAETEENTQRSRSFLFFAMAAIAATALPKVKSIIVPENGLISLNIPLEELRLGSLSTRTTHPFFISRMNEIFGGLGITGKLSNPYQFKTKGEMVRDCQNRRLLAAQVAGTISCSSPNSARMHFKTEQCGHCVPCLIRRAAFMGGGVADTTVYGIPKLNAKALYSNEKTGEHIRAFQAAIARLNDDPVRASIIVHESGPLSDNPGKYDEFGEVYRRGLKEVAALLKDVVTRPHV